MARPTWGASALLAAFLIAAGAPPSLAAQEPDSSVAAPVDMAREELVRFARAHVAINDARDAFHGQIARVHDEEGRRRAREQVDSRIAAILAEQEIEPAAYDEFILRISLDGDLRAAFEAVLQELAEEGV